MSAFDQELVELCHLLRDAPTCEEHLFARLLAYDPPRQREFVTFRVISHRVDVVPLNMKDG
jgi:hypothetical protein